MRTRRRRLLLLAFQPVRHLIAFAFHSNYPSLFQNITPQFIQQPLARRAAVDFESCNSKLIKFMYPVRRTNLTVYVLRTCTSGFETTRRVHGVPEQTVSWHFQTDNTRANWT